MGLCNSLRRVKLLTLVCATGRHRMEFRHSIIFPSFPFNFLLAILKYVNAKCVNFFVYLPLFLEMCGRVYYIVVELEDILQQLSWRLYIRHKL